MPDKSAISRALESARIALTTEFVPYNLGFNHVNRNEIINQHTSEVARQLMCNNEPGKAIIVIDETYIYIYSGEEDLLIFENISFLSHIRSRETTSSNEKASISTRKDHC